MGSEVHVGPRMDQVSCCWLEFSSQVSNSLFLESLAQGFTYFFLQFYDCLMAVHSKDMKQCNCVCSFRWSTLWLSLPVTLTQIRPHFINNSCRKLWHFTGFPYLFLSLSSVAYDLWPSVWWSLPLQRHCPMPVVSIFLLFCCIWDISEFGPPAHKSVAGVEPSTHTVTAGETHTYKMTFGPLSLEHNCWRHTQQKWWSFCSAECWP